MIFAKLVELIEIHAVRITRDVAQELVSNERTPSFRKVPAADLEPRLFEILHHLGDWIGDPDADKVRVEFEDWGSKRFGQGIPLSEIVYAVIVLKQHLRRYIRNHGLIDAAFPRVEADYILPMHLHSLQELNAVVGEFFDRAIYHLARGYEAETAERVL